MKSETRRSMRGLLALEHLHPVGHGWLVVATRGGRSKKKIFLEETPGYARRPSFGVYMIHLYVFCLAFARRGSKRKNPWATGVKYSVLAES